MPPKPTSSSSNSRRPSARLEQGIDRDLLVERAVESEGPAPDREPVVDPVGGVDAGAERDDLGLGAVVASRPAVVVLQRAAEVGAAPEAELEVRGHALREGEAAARDQPGRVAAVAAADRRVRAAIEMDVAVDQLRPDHQLRAVQAGHAGRIAEHRRRVLGERRPARGGGAEIRRAHLVNPKAGGRRRRCRQRHATGEQCETAGGPKITRRLQSGGERERPPLNRSRFSAMMKRGAHPAAPSRSVSLSSLR